MSFHLGPNDLQTLDGRVSFDHGIMVWYSTRRRHTRLAILRGFSLSRWWRCFIFLCSFSFICSLWRCFFRSFSKVREQGRHVVISLVISRGSFFPRLFSRCARCYYAFVKYEWNTKKIRIRKTCYRDSPETPPKSIFRRYSRWLFRFLHSFVYLVFCMLFKHLNI